MKFLVKVKPNLEETNKSIAEGTFHQRMEHVFSQIRPENAYFFEEGGRRTAMFIVDIQRESEIPNIGEPFFHGLKAEVYFHPVMSQQDLRESKLHEIAVNGAALSATREKS